MLKPSELTPAQKELYCCKMILEYAKKFYSDPENMHAFEVWKREKDKKSDPDSGENVSQKQL